MSQFYDLTADSFGATVATAQELRNRNADIIRDIEIGIYLAVQEVNFNYGGKS